MIIITLLVCFWVYPCTAQSSAQGSGKQKSPTQVKQDDQPITKTKGYSPKVILSGTIIFAGDIDGTYFYVSILEGDKEVAKLIPKKRKTGNIYDFSRSASIVETIPKDPIKLNQSIYKITLNKSNMNGASYTMDPPGNDTGPLVSSSCKAQPALKGVKFDLSKNLVIKFKVDSDSFCLK